MRISRYNLKLSPTLFLLSCIRLLCSDFLPFFQLLKNNKFVNASFQAENTIINLKELLKDDGFG